MLNRTTGYLVAAVAMLLWAGCATSPDQPAPPVTDYRTIETITIFSCCPVPEEAFANQHTDADRDCWVNPESNRIGTTQNRYWVWNNAWVNPATGEYCAEEGGDVVDMLRYIKMVGPIRGDFDD